MLRFLPGFRGAARLLRDRQAASVRRHFSLLDRTEKLMKTLNADILNLREEDEEIFAGRPIPYFQKTLEQFLAHQLAAAMPSEAY